MKTDKRVDFRMYNFNMQTGQSVFYWRKLSNALYIFKRNMIQSFAQANESSGLVNNVEYAMGEAFQMSSLWLFQENKSETSSRFQIFIAMILGL